ncbi:serine/threonine-protein kinase [Nocardia acididurans]|uniref:serine/threonine-protein kinase n=1 Tax=Nocardia acididurans TaxID=2802282 RepID=UPI003556E5A8
MRPGEIFAGYRITGVLGAGGMGTVYLARHPRLPREDAVKVLLPAASADETFRARFLREAELAARLRHPNIVTIHDRGENAGCLWIAMQYVAGSDAAEVARSGELPVWRAVHIIEEAARGLDAAHAAGLLHRDVKPANILIAQGSAGPDRVLVTDFGIARAVGDSTALTEEGEVLATLAYAAPEQISAGTVDHRADVYALGGTLYYLLTGRTPFPRPTPATVMYAHLYEQAPRPSHEKPGVPGEFDAVIARAMAKNPADRYPSCGALAAAAAAALRGEREPDMPVRVEPLPPPRRGRRPVTVVAVVALVLAVIAGVVFWRRPFGETPAAPASAQPSPTVSNARPWSTYQFVVDAFPDLLPRTPFDTGYRGIHCTAFATTNEDKAQYGASPPLDKAQTLAALQCLGDRDPVTNLIVACYTARNPMPNTQGLVPFEGTPATETWTRATGSGSIMWGMSAMSGTLGGQVALYFDSTTRNHCQIAVFGDLVTGQDLRDGWWPNAPI